MSPLPCPTGAARHDARAKNWGEKKLTLMCWRSSHCLIISDLQVFHCEILPRRRGVTGRDPGGLQIKPQSLANGGRRRESCLKRRGEPQSGHVGVEMTRESEELNTWKAPLANIPQINTQKSRVYYGTALGAAVSDFKVTGP